MLLIILAIISLVFVFLAIFMMFTGFKEEGIILFGVCMLFLLYYHHRYNLASSKLELKLRHSAGEIIYKVKGKYFIDREFDGTDCGFLCKNGFLYMSPNSMIFVNYDDIIKLNISDNDVIFSSANGLVIKVEIFSEFQRMSLHKHLYKCCGKIHKSDYKNKVPCVRSRSAWYTLDRPYGPAKQFE